MAKILKLVVITKRNKFNKSKFVPMDIKTIKYTISVNHSESAAVSTTTTISLQLQFQLITTALLR